MRDASLGYTHEVGGSFGSSPERAMYWLAVGGARDLGRRSSDRRRSVARTEPSCQGASVTARRSGSVGPDDVDPRIVAQTSSQSTSSAMDRAIIGTIAMR